MRRCLLHVPQGQAEEPAHELLLCDKVDYTDEEPKPKKRRSSSCSPAWEMTVDDVPDSSPEPARRVLRSAVRLSVSSNSKPFTQTESSPASGSSTCCFPPSPTAPVYSPISPPAREMPPPSAQRIPVLPPYVKAVLTPLGNSQMPRGATAASPGAQLEPRTATASKPPGMLLVNQTPVGRSLPRPVMALTSGSRSSAFPQTSADTAPDSLTTSVKLPPPAWQPVAHPGPSRVESDHSSYSARISPASPPTTSVDYTDELRWLDDIVFRAGVPEVHAGGELFKDEWFDFLDEQHSD